MDHIVQLRVEHQSSPKLCNRGVARFTSSAEDTSLVTLAALAAIATLTLLLLSSFSMTSSQHSSTLPARLLAAGSIFTSKTALFVLSNVVIVLLAADYRCRFATAASACRATSSGEPGGGVLVMEKQAQHHQVQVEQCAVLSCVPCSESLGDHNEQESEDRSTMSAKTSPDEKEKLSELERVRLGEEEDSSSTLEETDDDVEEPACETGQGLDGLEISELNRKFDEFIRSRRIKWVKEEAYLLLCEV